MSKQETPLWESGVTDAPLPPMVDPRDMMNASRLFVEQYRKLGPIFRLPGRGKPLTVLVGPEANVFMARYEDEFFTTRLPWEDFDSSMTAIGNARPPEHEKEQREGIQEHQGDGQANRERRARISRSYSRARVLDQLPRMVELTLEHTQDWQPGQSISVLSAMQRIVAEQLGELLVHHGTGDYLEDFKTYLDTNIIAAYSSSPESRAALTAPHYLSAKERAHELGKLILQEHRAIPAHTAHPDLVYDVLEEATKHLEEYPESVLEGAGLGPLLAGLDTVANSCSFMLYALLKHRDVYERVMRDVNALFAQGPLTWEHLKTMQDLHGAAIETLRIYPVAGGHSTRVAKPLTFAGYCLEPGDDVLIAMTATHFLPELFPEPETFDIDRYHAPRNEHRQRGAYAPFGLGEHTCLGAGIAEIQLMVIIATLLHRYQLKLDPADYELVIEHTPTPSPGKGFRVRVSHVVP